MLAAEERAQQREQELEEAHGQATAALIEQEEKKHKELTDHIAALQSTIQSLESKVGIPNSGCGGPYIPQILCAGTRTAERFI